ncbi:hypothetical protein HDV00_004747 [Rhizophlyctis rosea]|nr:hypothetical protein HDV00_004747 [Rhizophlyctis rosea]
MPPKRKPTETGTTSTAKKPKQTSTIVRAPAFTEEENKLLESLVEKHGSDWDKIFEEFNEARGRSKKALQKRWSNMMQTKKEREAKESGSS